MKLTRQQVAQFIAPEQNQNAMNSATKQWLRSPAEALRLHSGVNVSKRSSAVANIFSRENKHVKVPNIGSLQMSQEIRDFFDRVVFSNKTHVYTPPPLAKIRAQSRMVDLSQQYQHDEMEKLMEEMKKLNVKLGINEDGILMVNNSQFQLYDDTYNVNFDYARRGVVRKSLTRSRHSFLSPKLWYRGLSYILALDFWEQKISGIRNLLSLQCWASHLGHNVEVVEPFIIGSKLEGLPLNESDSNQSMPLSFGGLYNRSAWNRGAPKYSKANLAKLSEWSKFIMLAPQSVILVTLFYGDLPASADCPMHVLSEQTRDFILTFDMEVISEVCIDLKEIGPVTTAEFDTLVFGNHNINDTDVTVIFSQWRGVLNKEGLRVCLVDSPCAQRWLGFSHFGSYLQPNKDVIADANTFIRLHYPNRLFTGVVIHIEKMVTTSSEGESSSALDIVKKCYVKIINDWSSLMNRTKINSTFLSMDLNVYGNSVFSMHHLKPIHVNLSAEIENITHSLLGRRMSTEKWNKIIDTVASVDNPAYIGLMQTAIAFKSRCIILAGGGLLQEHVLQLYKRAHPKKENRCYVHLNQHCIRTGYSIPNA